MALRCLTSLEANNKTVNLLQLTSEAMASIWETNRSDYNWYNSTSSAPTEYIVSEGDDILEDLFTREWVSSGETDYTISDSRNSYFFKKYDSSVGSRNSVGIQPYDYGSSNIFGRYQQGELAILKYQYAIIIDDENEEAVIVFYQTRNGSGYSTFYRFTVYTGTNYRHTLWLDFTDAEPQTKITSNGGGATHIAKVTGQLKDLSSNLSDILMVSGGGGGGLLLGETEYTGKEAGGISGSGDNSADQSTGNAFGQGESGTDVSGGGSGLYGGYKGTSSKSGGAGSGYIGNSLLSNKKMVGYNVPISSDESTKTESVNEASESPVSGKPKSGNGFARIKLLSEGKTVTYKSIAKTYNMTHYVTGGDGSNANIKGAFSSYKNTDYILWSAISSSVYSRERPFDYNNSTGIFSFNSTNYAESGFYGYVLFPFISKSKILKVSFKVRIQTNSGTDFGVRLRDTDLNSSTMLTMFLSDPATQMDWTTVEYTVPDAYRSTEYGWLQMHFQAKVEVKDVVFTYLE